MDHDYIEKEQIVDAYLMGKLSPVEKDRFEEHYVSCKECLDALELTEVMQRGLKKVVSEDSVAGLSPARRTVPSRTAGWRWFGALATAASVLLTISVALLYQDVRRLEQERERYRSTLDDLRDELGSEQRASEALERNLETARGELSAGGRQLIEEQAARNGLAEELRLSRRPQTNTPLVALNMRPERGPAGTQEPSQRIRLPATPQWLVFSLQLDIPVRATFQTYSVSLRKGEGAVLWQGDGLRPNYQDALIFSLYSSSLEAGVYYLDVSGLSPQAVPDLVATFSFEARTVE